MKKHNLVSIAVGSAFAAAALTPLAHAADNPFGVSKLQTAYQVAEADKMKDASCGADKKKDASCGADKKKSARHASDKMKDASCGADKKMEGQGTMDKKMDASCGAKK